MKIEAWAALLENRPDLSDKAILVEWAALSRPLVVRRRGSGDWGDAIAAGIPLPPSQGKLRVAVALAPSSISSVGPPLLLASSRTAAPAAWLKTVDAVLDLGARVGIDPRVFGSFAWAALTGLDYVSASSDLDLLWAVSPETDFDALLQGLARIEAAAPGRLDGELINAKTGMAANWRELHSGADQILVKSLEGVALQPASVFLHALETLA